MTRKLTFVAAFAVLLFCVAAVSVSAGDKPDRKPDRPRAEGDRPVHPMRALHQEMESLRERIEDAKKGGDNSAVENLTEQLKKAEQKMQEFRKEHKPEGFRGEKRDEGRPEPPMMERLEHQRKELRHRAEKLENALKGAKEAGCEDEVKSFTAKLDAVKEQLAHNEKTAERFRENLKKEGDRRPEGRPEGRFGGRPFGPEGREPGHFGPEGRPFDRERGRGPGGSEGSRPEFGPEHHHEMMKVMHELRKEVHELKREVEILKKSK